MAISAKDILWRDYVAEEALRDVVARTSALLVTAHGKYEGWLYVGASGFVFIGDKALFSTAPIPTNNDRILTMSYDDLLGVKELTSPRVAPNALIEFGCGMTLQGACKQIRTLAELVKQWPQSRQSLAREDQTEPSIVNPAVQPLVAEADLTSKRRPAPKRRQR